MLNRRNWILPPLLSIGFVLIFFMYAAHAALLKDIRIGEYDKFTRIVFELDSPTEPQKIDMVSSGRLAVVFANTSAEFIRKIPVERSRHIRAIQIWDRSNQISAILSFDFEHFRHESFPLKNPPRVVLDIQPLATAPAANTAEAPIETATNAGGFSKDEESETPVSFPGQTQETLHPTNQINPAGTGADPVNSPSSDTPSNQYPAAPDTRPSGPVSVDHKAAEPTAHATVPDHPKPAKRSSRLQFYLVVMLVLITIVILMLLLLMLLSRHRWTEDNQQMKPKEFLKNQDKHIASLDARIREQLKRYEEV